MILFIVEGKKKEPKYIEAMFKVYPDLVSKEEPIVCSYNNHIYALSTEIERFREAGGEVDVIHLLKNRHNKDLNNQIHRIQNSNQIAQIYLLFDFDPQCGSDPSQIDKMLSIFDDETDVGKLLISYPTIESLCQDDLNRDSIVRKDECKGYKQKVNNTYPRGHLFLCGDRHTEPDKSFWDRQAQHYVKKANCLCQGNYDYPKSLDDVSQSNIFEKQGQRVQPPRDEVFVLNALPLYLLNHYGVSAFQQKYS